MTGVDGNVTPPAYASGAMYARLRLFLSSYVPLFAIAAVRLDGTRVRVALAVLSLTGLVSLISLVRVSKRVEPRRVTPSGVVDLGSEVASYLATYLLPFLMVGEPDAADIVAYTLVLATIAVVFVKSDMVGVNPLLYLLGYRIYAADGVRQTASGQPRRSLLISRLDVSDCAMLTVTDLAKGASLVQTIDEEGAK